jgi:hypothetical protein
MLPSTTIDWGFAVAGNRVFLPQQALHQWLGQGRVTLVDDELTITPAGRRFRLVSAVRFLREVGGASDTAGLVGKVKTVEQVQALQGELCADSVILGDNAYEVIEGFLGEPLPASAARKGSGSRVPVPQDEQLDDPLARLSNPG